MDTKLLLEVLDKNIDQQGLAKDLVLVLVMPLVEKFVADTSNPYDDMLVKALKEFIEAQVKA